MKSITLIVLLLSLFLFQNCGSDDEETCQNCVNNEFVAEVENLQVTLLRHINGDTILVKNPYTAEDTIYNICNVEVLGNLERQKVLNVKGQISHNCDSTFVDLISISDLEVVDYCFDPIPASNGNFDLFNQWVIYSIETPDTILYTPCEIYYTPTLTFRQGGGDVEHGEFPNRLSIETGIDNTYPSFTISGDSVLTKPGVTSFVINVNTRASSFWYNRINDIIASPNDTTIFLFDISSNVLTLQNPISSSTLKLYVQ